MENRFIAIPEITIDTATCTKCGQCLCICPSNSIHHSGFEKSNFKTIPNQAVKTEDAFALLTQRRSLRNYKKEIPSVELLTKVVEIAGYAPSSPHHRVGWVRNVTIVTGYENMKIVSDITSDYMDKMITMLGSWYMKLAAKYDDRAKAGVGIVTSFKEALNMYREGKDMITYNAPAAIFIHAPVTSSTPQIDCAAACLQIQLYAEANGLGTCWNGLIQGAASGEYLKGFKKLKEFLKIPEGHECYAAMTIGFPSVALHSIPERKTDITWID